MPYRAHMAGAGGLPPFRHHPDLGCRAVDPLDVMVPAGYTDREVADARTVCEHCPIWETCLAWAIVHDPNEGVYAGTTPGQRQRIATGAEGWPTRPPAPRRRKPQGPRRAYKPRAGVDWERQFAAGRAFNGGVGRDVVVARYGVSKPVLYRVLRVLRYAPDLVDEVVGLRMTLKAAHLVAQSRAGSVAA